jgi:hypothetical protein
VSISDAQFAEFLKDSMAINGPRRTVLAEFNYVFQDGTLDGGDGDVAHPMVGTLFLADHPYNTKNATVTLNRKYDDCILSVPNFTQSVNLNTLTGKTALSVGEMVLANDDGHLDYLLNLIVDSWSCNFYVGSHLWARSDFRIVQRTVIQKITAPAENRISFALTDLGLLLNSSLVGNNIGGTGPNFGKPGPRIMGYCNNVEAVLTDSALLEYEAADLAGTVYGVYDSGLPLTADDPFVSDLGATFTVDTGADTISHPTLICAIDDILAFTTVATMGITSGTPYFVKTSVPSTGTISLSATRGGSTLDLTASFSGGETVVVVRYAAVASILNGGLGPTIVTLAHAPAGRVTVDIDSPIQTNSRATDLLQYVSSYTPTILPSFTEDDDACDFHLGVAVLERRNKTDIIDDITFSANAFWGFNQTSQLILGRIRPQDLGSMTIELEIGKDDMIGDESSIVVDQIPPSYKDARGYFYKTWTDQRDGFVSGILLDRLSYLQSGGFFAQVPNPTGDLYTSDPSKYHFTMISSPNYMTMISKASCGDAYAEMLTWLEDKKDQTLPFLQLFKCRVGLHAHSLQLGSCVNMTLDRFGLDAGERFQVVSINVILTDAIIELTLLRRDPGRYDFNDIYLPLYGGYNPGEEYSN